MELNYSIVPVRPAGGAWSNVNDVLKYVQMELADGTLPDGKRYVTETVLKERLTPQVSIGGTALTRWDFSSIPRMASPSLLMAAA